MAVLLLYNNPGMSEPSCVCARVVPMEGQSVTVKRWCLLSGNARKRVRLVSLFLGIGVYITGASLRVIAQAY